MSVGNGIAIDELRRIAKATDLAGFRATQARAFLMVHVIDVAPQAADTVKSKNKSPAPAPTAATAAVVFPLKRLAGSQLDWIAVGRAETNDVFLPHASISRFHAFFRELGATMVLQDARSSNGTWVGEVRVAVQGEGPAVAVTPGNIVRFGDVPATFLNAEGLYSILTKLG